MKIANIPSFIATAPSILLSPTLRSNCAQGQRASTRSSLELRPINPLFSSEWDQTISRHPAATIFHTSAWARVLQETYRYLPFYFATDTEIPATLCLFEVNSWLTGRRGVSLPFTDQCLPLESPECGFDSLFERAREIGKQRKWASLEVRGAIENRNFPASLSFYTHTLSLEQSPEALFEALDSSTRRAIRKAEKAELDISFNHTRDSVREYYRLHCITRRKHGLPPQPWRFFDSIYRHLIKPQLGFIALARHHGKAIAGSVFFQFKDSALYKFGASDSEHEALRPNNLLMWRAIQHLAASGAKTLDFGRTSLQNDGLRRYKLQWGAREQTANYIKWGFRESNFLQDKDKSFGMQNRIFRLFPPVLARAAGSILYPHIG